MTRTVFTLLALVLAALSPLQALEVGDPMEDKGTIISLDGGQSLQLMIDGDKKIAAYFFDDQGKAMESPAASIVFVVDHPGNKNDKYRTVLVQGPDAGMLGPRVLYTPYQLKVRLIIRLKDGDAKTIPYTQVQLDRNIAGAAEE